MAHKQTFVVAISFAVEESKLEKGLMILKTLFQG